MKENLELLPPTHFVRRIEAGEFVFGGEIEYSTSLDMDDYKKQLKMQDERISAITIPDNPGSNIFISNLVIAQRIRALTAKDLILSISCRDTNRMGLASTVISASALGLQNLLLVTGDHPALGSVPKTKPVFDLDSTQLLELCQEFNKTRTIYGKSFQSATDHLMTEQKPSKEEKKLILGAVMNINSTNPHLEMIKIDRKLNLGLDFIQTQIFFDIDRIVPVLTQLKNRQVPTMVGIAPMNNYNLAAKIAHFLPGVSFPEEILQNYKSISQKTENPIDRARKFDEFNQKYYSPLLLELKKKKLVQGVYFATVEYPEITPLIINDLI